MGADLSGQQKVNDWVTLKGKLFYHYHNDLLESLYDTTLNQEIARSEYKDNTMGGNVLGEMNLTSNDTLRANFLYRRDDHEQRAVAYLPFQEDVSYTGSFGIEDQFDPIKPLSIVAGVGYDWWEVAQSNQVDTNSSGCLHEFPRLQDPECRQGGPHGRGDLYV